MLFFGTAGTGTNIIFGQFLNFVLNGKTQPEAIDLKAGTRYRLRLFNFAGDVPTMVSLNQGDKPVMWRAVAKDGYPLPASQAVSRPAARFSAAAPPPPPVLPPTVTVAVRVR